MPREDVKGTVVIETPPEQTPIGLLTYLLFGMSTDDFVKDLQINREKYFQKINIS